MLAVITGLTGPLSGVASDSAPCGSKSTRPSRLDDAESNEASGSVRAKNRVVPGRAGAIQVECVQSAAERPVDA